MDCLLLVLVVVAIPTGVGVGVAAGKAIDPGWAVIGALLLSLFLANVLAGSVATQEQLNQAALEVASDEWAFLGRWLGAIALVCSPLLTAVFLGIGTASGAIVGAHYAPK